jgi:aspartyl-tRNA(Asn)/glutamyl-tRNA(Gln) amidotransferase subunit A
MSRTVRDSALLLQVLSGHDPRDASSLREKPDDYLAAADRGVKGLRVGWSPDFGFAAVDPEVVTGVAKAAHSFKELGCTVEEAALDLESPFEAFWTLFTAIFCARSGSLCEEHWEELTSYTQDACDRGREVTGAEYALALGEVDRLKAKFARLFERYDLLLSPTTAVPAFPTGRPPATIAGRDVDSFWGYLPFTFPINMIGHPAASIPCGFSSDGLPISLHIVGRRGDEATVIAASAAFEEARPWVQHRPVVS